jgi:hypothetical protein
MAAVGFLKGRGCRYGRGWVFKGGAVVEMGAVGCSNGGGC